MQKSASLKKNAILNILKQLLKIAFPLITFPYVSRILLDENLGKYNFSLSIISYFTLIAGLGINSYAIREGARIRSNKKECNQLGNELFTINLITTALSYCLLIITCVFWRKMHGYIGLVAVQSTTILFTTLGVDWVNGIYEDYEYMTKRYVFVKLVSLVFIFLLIKKKEDYILYAAIVSGSEVLANVLNIFYVRRYLKIRPIRKPQLKKHIWPLMVLFANAIAITVYSNADITMLGIFKDDSIVGIYSVSSKMYQIAKSLINAIIVVTVPRLAAILGSGNLEGYNRLLEKTLKSIVIFMFPIVTGMFVLSKECVLLLGGEAFVQGELAVKILSLALIPAAINSVFFDGILIANRKEKYCLMSTLLSALVNVGLNLYFIPRFSLYGAAFTTLIAEALGCGLAIFFSKGSHNMYLVFDRDYWSVVFGCILVASVCLLSSSLQSIILKTIVAVSISVIVYGVALLLLKNTILLELMRSIFRRFKQKQSDA